MALKDWEIKKFKEQGFIKIERVFDEKQAEEGRSRFWLEAVNLALKAKSRPKYKKIFDADDNERYITLQRDPIRKSSAKIVKEIEPMVAELLGGKYVKPEIDYWRISRPGVKARDWHVDGNWNYEHKRLNPGLTAAFLFSDIHENGGATMVYPGSHLRMANCPEFCANPKKPLYPDDSKGKEEWEKRIEYIIKWKPRRTEEMVGKAGGCLSIPPNARP